MNDIFDTINNTEILEMFMLNVTYCACFCVCRAYYYAMQNQLLLQIKKGMS